MAELKIREVPLKVNFVFPRSVVIPDNVTVAVGFVFKTTLNDAVRVPSSLTISPELGVTV